MESKNILIYDNLPPLVAPSGVARYFRHFCNGMTSFFGSHITIFSPNKRNINSSDYIRALPTNFRGSKRFGIQLLNNLLVLRIAEKRHAAVFYSPYYGTVQTKAAQVFTV